MDSAKTMKAVVFTKVLKEPKGMEISDWPVPELKDGNVLVKVYCFGLNFADTMSRKGEYPDAPPVPFVPGYEFSGVVEAVGKDVTGFSAGDRVFGYTQFGGYAEYVSTPAHYVVHLPKSLTFEEGASIPVNFCTAHLAIHSGQIYEGDKVLIHAAAGGVGLAAVQIAKQEGMVVYGTSSSADKLKLLKDEFGVDHVINYRTSDFAEEIQKIEGKQEACIDLILDSIGGTHFKKELPLLRAGGRLVSFGVSALSVNMNISNAFSMLSNVVSMVTLNSIDLLKDSKSFIGLNVIRIAATRPKAIQKLLKELVRMFEEGKLKTSVHQVFPWDKINDAHEAMESRASTGKLILYVTSHYNGDDKYKKQ